MRIHLLVNYTDPDLGFLGHKNFQTPFGFKEKNMFQIFYVVISFKVAGSEYNLRIRPDSDPQHCTKLLSYRPF